MRNQDLSWATLGPLSALLQALLQTFTVPQRSYKYRLTNLLRHNRSPIPARNYDSITRDERIPAMISAM